MYVRLEQNLHNYDVSKYKSTQCRHYVLEGEWREIHSGSEDTDNISCKNRIKGKVPIPRCVLF